MTPEVREAPSLDDRFAAAMGQCLGPDFPAEIGLAVSGGGDSMAMLALAHNWTKRWGVRLRVVTVDHGLRPGSADEARLVAEECRVLGWPHDTLKWTGWDGQGNLQDAARRARLSLIDGWRQGMRDVLFAHTADDQAETLLMRLRRGSGVEGLSGMAQIREAGAMRIVRPLLDERRDALRFYLRVMRIPFADDPSNEDTGFERVRMRKLLADLDEAGLGVEALTGTARRMARAGEALKARAADIAARLTRLDWGQIVIDRDGFAETERDTQMRLLAASLRFVAGGAYRPRADALEALLDSALSGKGGTLGGAALHVEAGEMRIVRELNAVETMEITAGSGTLWDGRWRIEGPEINGLSVRALGTRGWSQVTPKPQTGPRFRQALSLPAVFRGETLVACAALEFGPPHTCRFEAPAPSLSGFVLSH
ncbi:tRNA(Ile)-lysidine synthase [Roseivivax sp. THAF40]|uniref:tRNA lysidine(34) synthetase TilS n=1 Tax=unclassified Roseivivax TaxID=2639302 RepID=UPI0012A8AD7C|nr:MULTISPECIES: tRNA lysidine(34) synthetase TilS [unclassified Roseivivax]QFS81618.1 tRNA(Ile)-lysidine synthase [Roseivivax sp. THAF197b]QFT45347.1 tRNA(Ile)-lysidine synthase [Roseivivax sp. THAF40]